MRAPSQSHLISSSHKLMRKVVVVLPQQDFALSAKGRSKAQSFNAYTMTLAGKVKNILDNHIDKLNSMIDVCVPYIRIELVRFSNDNPNILSDEERCGSFRLITIFSEKTTYSLDESKYYNEDISHLIQINIDFDSESQKELINACYTVNKESLANRIADILLDIAMYHSWFDEENELFNAKDLTFRRNFSKEKVKYICEHNEEYNNLIKDCKPTDTYYCFAFACYDKNGNFDYQKYEKIWKTFVKQYITEPTNGGTIEQQIASLKIKGQLSISKIKKSYDQLPKGKHLLLVSRKEPKNHKIRRQVFSLMKFTDTGWKTNRFRFYPLKDYDRIARCIPFIQVSIIKK